MRDGARIALDLLYKDGVYTVRWSGLSVGFSTESAPLALADALRTFEYVLGGVGAWASVPEDKKMELAKALEGPKEDK